MLPLDHLAQSVISPPTGTTLPTGEIGSYMVNVINWGIGIAGTVAVLVLVISGFLYVTASGDETRLERAKKGIRGAITGIIIMLIAAVIVNTINYAILRGRGSSTPRTPSRSDLFV
ncbi:MAG: pilin [Parcubacteria group bacterium]